MHEQDLEQSVNNGRATQQGVGGELVTEPDSRESTLKRAKNAYTLMPWPLLPSRHDSSLALRRGTLGEDLPPSGKVRYYARHHPPGPMHHRLKKKTVGVDPLAWMMRLDT